MWPRCLLSSGDSQTTISRLGCRDSRDSIKMLMVSMRSLTVEISIVVYGTVSLHQDGSSQHDRCGFVGVETYSPW